jgi:hypothetical protein
MDQGSLTAVDQAGEHTVQILHRVVLDRAIGVAGLMVALRDRLAAGTMLDKRRMGFCHMRGVAADDGDDAEDLGDKVQSDDPRT